MDKITKKITYSAIAAAVVFVVTWMIRVPVPATSGGYVNVGDVVIFSVAYLLGGPIAAAAAAVGSALADLAAGAAVYAPATFVIKGLMGLVCGFLTVRKTFRAFALSCVAGGAIMAAGYGVYECAVFGLAYALAALPFNLIQWGGSAIIAVALYPVISRSLKSIMPRGV